MKCLLILVYMVIILFKNKLQVYEVMISSISILAHITILITKAFTMYANIIIFDKDICFTT
jgi:hypothetical protein